MRKLHEIFNAAKLHHCYWVGISGTQYMCHALEYAKLEGAISESELLEAKHFAQELVESFDPESLSLAGAMSMYFYRKNVDPDICWMDVAGMVWEAVIGKLTLEDK